MFSKRGLRLCGLSNSGVKPWPLNDRNKPHAWALRVMQFNCVDLAVIFWGADPPIGYCACGLPLPLIQGSSFTWLNMWTSGRCPMLVEGLEAMRPSVAAGNLLASRTQFLRPGTMNCRLHLLPCQDLRAHFCGACYWCILACGATSTQGHNGTARVALVPITAGVCACTMSSNWHSQVTFCLDAGLDCMM